MQLTREYLYSDSDFQHVLEELKRKIRPLPPLFAFGFYILRLRAAKLKRMPYKVFAVFNPSFWQRGQSATPLFIAETDIGLSFIGNYGDYYSLQTVARPDYDSASVRFIIDRMKSLSGAYVDVGANMGIIAASVAKSLADREEVYAFEPVHETAERAGGMFALNGITNVTLFECAVGNQNTMLSFYRTTFFSEASAASTNGRTEKELTEFQVPCRTLDSLSVEGVIGKVGLLKMDVEGYEIKALQGARTVIARDQPEIIFECHRDLLPYSGWTLADAVALISELGDYEFYFIREDGGLAPLPPPADSRPDINIYCRCRSASS